MIGFETYLKRFPKVSRLRAEQLMEWDYFFLKRGTEEIALMPRNSASDELVAVELGHLQCQCNVYRTKQACSHVAAALGIVENNGGTIPFTDPEKLVFACIEGIRNPRNPTYRSFETERMLRNMEPFVNRLPEKEKPRFILEMARCFEDKGSGIRKEKFTSICQLVSEGYYLEKKHGALLYEHRRECMSAVVILMSSTYGELFTEKEMETILKEIAADDKMAQNCLPYLVDSHADAFTRAQLLRYYQAQGPEGVNGYFAEELLKRLVMEEPPLYEEFLDVCNSNPNGGYYPLPVELVEKVVKAGYGDRLGMAATQLVKRISSVEDYEKVIQVLSHEQFLKAWKERMKEKHRGWYSRYSEMEIEISLREDPEYGADDIDLDSVGYSLLEAIRETHPEYTDEVNKAVRKRYRGALKLPRGREQALEALEVLMRGGDAIASKYASELDVVKNPEDMVYVLAAGMRFDTLAKLCPEMKMLEVPDAADKNHE